MPLLGEHGHVRYTRPHLRGHRLGPDGTAGRAWSTRFITDTFLVEEDRLHLTATDADAQLGVALELESLPGGSLRGRWSLTNCGATTLAEPQAVGYGSPLGCTFPLVSAREVERLGEVVCDR